MSYAENCPEDLIIQDIEQCRNIAKMHMTADFIPTVPESKSSRLPNGCFWYAPPNADPMQYSFNPELDPKKVTAPFADSYGGVCHSIG